MKMVAGTARSMGITVTVDNSPHAFELFPLQSHKVLGNVHEKSLGTNGELLESSTPHNTK